MVPWNRLVRFVAEEDDSIHYGDAIVPSREFDVGSPKNISLLKAYAITGNPFATNCAVTDTVLTVKVLLGPLTSDTVPAVRCIGGNYAHHRK